MMIFSTGLLLLAVASSAFGQCQYIYVAEPPSGQLICDPFPTNQLRLVCSIFATNISQPDILTVQWFFSNLVNQQFIPVNSVLLQEVRFDVTISPETYTSRIVVSQLHVKQIVLL